MNDSELYRFFELEIRHVCQRVGVPTTGMQEPLELLNGIAGANPEVHRLMVVFLRAYQAWNNFTETLIGMGMSGKLSGADHEKLRTLTNLRDATRKQLQDKVNALPQ